MRKSSFFYKKRPTFKITANGQRRRPHSLNIDIAFNASSLVRPTSRLVWI